METKLETNYLIDWHSDSAEAIAAKKQYFYMLRMLLAELQDADDHGSIADILQKYNVYFIDIDGFPRVNLDLPKEYV
jgi:hypothetical protein